MPMKEFQSKQEEIQVQDLEKGKDRCEVNSSNL
jgi:hypothetical protein